MQLFSIPESLDQLEKMVTPLFGKVFNTDKKQFIFQFQHHPWGAGTAGS